MLLLKVMVGALKKGVNTFSLFLQFWNRFKTIFSIQLQQYFCIGPSLKPKENTFKCMIVKNQNWVFKSKKQ